MELSAAIGKRAAGYAAATLVREGMCLGLGTGSTAKYFIEAVAERVAGGLNVTAVATSRQSVELASKLGIVVGELTAEGVDLAVDGADCADHQLQLIKGGGGAHVRERIVAASAKEFVVIVDDSKIVDALHGPVPVEILEFGCAATVAKLAQTGARFQLRQDEQGSLVRSDSGNLLADGEFGVITDAKSLAGEIASIPGVVGHGIFIGMAKRVLVGHAEGGVDELLLQ